MIKLEQIKPNFNKVTVHHVVIWFSYQTPVAVEYLNILKISQNIWSTTTGKHLNYIEPDKSKRVGWDEVLYAIEVFLKPNN